MRSMNMCRRFEVRQPDGSWCAAHMEQLDMGDIVRIYQVKAIATYEVEGTETFIEATVNDVASLDLSITVNPDNVKALEADILNEGDFSDKTETFTDDWMPGEGDMYEQGQRVMLWCAQKQLENDDVKKPISVFDMKLAVIERLDQINASNELREATWTILCEEEADILAEIDGEYGLEGIPQGDDPDFEKVMLLADTNEEFDDMNEYFIPTNPHDRVLRTFFEKKMSLRQIRVAMKELGVKANEGQLEYKRFTYERWLQNLHS